MNALTQLLRDAEQLSIDIAGLNETTGRDVTGHAVDDIRRVIEANSRFSQAIAREVGISTTARDLTAAMQQVTRTLAGNREVVRAYHEALHRLSRLA